ncbi:hypothetical protein LC586_34870 [Nostoc sp. CHAB 5714]|uniref:Uncharacterized protein n=1 Tax=Nostoc favosum CHAB5714 TaxID=2780399 RepID=A0ABS8IKB3_9NOSO|nr:hypothetical protein [Nostoc favosum CHAB5714]
MRRLVCVMLAAGLAVSTQQAFACNSSSWRLQHKSFLVQRSSETPFTVLLGTGEAHTADVTVDIYQRPGEVDVRARNSGPFVDPGMPTRSAGKIAVVFRVARSGAGTIAVDVIDGEGKVTRMISHALKVEVRPFLRC